MAPKVIGATGAPPIPLERISEITLCAEVICEVIGHYKMYTLQESRHAPAGIRKAAREARFTGASTAAKVEVNVSTELNARSVANSSISQAPSHVNKPSKGFEKGATSRDTARPGLRYANDANHDNQSAAPVGNVKDAGSEGYRRTADDTAALNAALNAGPMFYAVPTDEALAQMFTSHGADPGRKDGTKPKDADDDNGSTADSKAGGKAESTGDEKSTSSKPRRGVVAPGDFMKQFRKLQEQKKSAPKVVPAGPPRRIVFGNLPEWADIAGILQFVHGGAIERAWMEHTEVIVQFIDQEKCVQYYEAHSHGIRLKDDDDEVTISVTMPEEGLPDNEKLWIRVEEGASRVVCLCGLPIGLKGGNDEAIFGIISDPTWEGKRFDHIVIKQAPEGVDVTIFFYDLHDGWEFFQTIKNGIYDCIAKFEVDPCASAQGFHFMDEPNPMFTAFLNAAD
ncbi:hypothetical protein N7457_006925 [Penicillium paradoxum]|uniref:uncharacterized protein n=1 Tax=Penicillium paradoxum TaxID=176176 RepID=UPI00254830D4|nr:uncharacterized protein N7457_006925 [Penicillium paradoxum]KAJ5779205.1 hypothetical protein N7457_006925 [Penicillium paradoxum]